MKSVYIKTYGCQMNERDSEAVAALLERRGYRLVGSEHQADVVLLNTCSVRDFAEQKAIGKMGQLAGLKRRRPQLVLGYLGCLAQSRGGALAAAMPGVDLVVGTQRAHHVPGYLDRIFADRARQAAVADVALRDPVRSAIVDTAAEAGSESAVDAHRLGTNGDRSVTAYVSIMQGCDRRCSFCIVPFTRGRERSRPIPEIVDEVTRLVGGGVKEVTLLGQIVTSYGRATVPRRDGRSGFVQLLEAVHAVPGLERIRFTSPHPKGFGDDLVAAYARLPNLCAHAHLPVQSGSDPVLRRMRRGYTRAWYLRIVDRLRAARPGLGITTDLIVGFPGETEAEFESTRSLVEEVGFDQAYLFKYSARQDTPAAARPGQVDEETKRRRHQILLATVNRAALARNQELVGSAVEVLVEGPSRKRPERLTGRTGSNKIAVFADDGALRGDLVTLRVERATT
ncbi:tRNA (N6-isopentenyl adenosine(37)-C2)-methylthiotransferase MiaB, partial [bacterium]|nr:tRNA (N6-isopentenyl adenosine(37)-C2)-methylthiotransferase MiaB [bacterium]